MCLLNILFVYNISHAQKSTTILLKFLKTKYPSWSYVLRKFYLGILSNHIKIKERRKTQLFVY